MRTSSDKERGSLKMAFARAVEALGGGKIVAMMTRVKEPALSLYAATHEEDRHVALDVAFDIDRAHVDAGNQPPIAAAYCALMGFELVRTVPFTDAAPLSVADVARLDRESFEARTELYDDLIDGRMTLAEKRRALKHLDDLMRACAGIRAKVEAA